MSMTDQTAILILCTCPDTDSATRISERLVSTRLAACVNRVPGIHSCYVWQGELQTDDEVLLLIKSTSQCYAAVQTLILELHPYELPEIIVVPIDTGHAPYLDWIAANTTER